MTDAVLRTMTYQVELALHYCRTPTFSKGVVLHSDVKPDNDAKVSFGDGEHVDERRWFSFRSHYSKGESQICGLLAREAAGTQTHPGTLQR